MPITLEQLRSIMPHLRGDKAELNLEPLNRAMEVFDINTPTRQAAFLAQIAHESAELLYTKEIASGHEYEGRVDLGNTQPGDGVKFKGRGEIQITGRDNYRECGLALGLPLEEQPELLEEPENGFLGSAWFWYKHGLNELADNNTDKDFKQITHKINGGYNGLDKRIAFWYTAKNVLNC